MPSTLPSDADSSSRDSNGKLVVPNLLFQGFLRFNFFISISFFLFLARWSLC